MPLYVDTTVVIDRVLSKGENRLHIERVLSEAEVSSSHYVHQQFAATILAAATVAHTQLKLGLPFQDVLRDLEGYKCTKGHDGRKARLVIYALMEKSQDTSDALATLERWLRNDYLRKRAFRNVRLVDNTHCCQCDELQYRDGDFHLNSRCSLKNSRPCRIEEFWTDHKEDLKGIAQIDPPKAKHLEKAVATAREVIERKAKPRGDRCRYHLSDAVIAAESPETAVVRTSNLQDFEPICAALETPREVEGL
jgi:hypothetical protein